MLQPRCRGFWGSSLFFRIRGVRSTVVEFEALSAPSKSASCGTRRTFPRPAELWELWASACEAAGRRQPARKMPGLGFRVYGKYCRGLGLGITPLRVLLEAFGRRFCYLVALGLRIRSLGYKVLGSSEGRYTWALSMAPYLL